ncbi:MAG TPA: hypothetical protein VGO68_15415 [Pyrinomonadaceae bacterium]|jgi:hypothetical protein|nr:hypothetical protein [Pyrinomonadaceae bacterium]
MISFLTIIRRLKCLVLVFCVGSTVLAQQDPKMAKAAKNGKILATRITVPNNVTAQAVLIPQIDARRIFGKEIADNYAVIEVNVGNKSSDAALIIHGIFIDYSHWALSGSPGPGPNVVDGLLRGPAQPFQVATSPNQIASEEYRVVRGQLLDAQMWSKRNWTMRLLTLAGNLASAYAFSISEEGIVRGLNAFSGSVVPGIKEAWPDGTIEQLNRVSDFGYQANKVIPKEGAEIIVCFFPIDRFLTPGFKKLFLKSPALFFAPLQMLMDKSLKNDANDLLHGINPQLDVAKLSTSLPCYLRVVRELRYGPDADDGSAAKQVIRNASQNCYQQMGLKRRTDGSKPALDKDGRQILDVKAEPDFQNFLALDFLSQMSLNTVSVTIDGVMSVETSTLAGKIDAVTFDKITNCDLDSACFWANPATRDGVRTGTISGSYLTGGSIEIAEAEELGITDLKTISEGSNDQKLQFSFKLTKPIAAEKSFHFIVTKPKAGSEGPDATIDSIPLEYPIRFTTSPPAIGVVEQGDGKLAVKGSNFLDLPLVVTLRSPSRETLTVDPALFTTKNDHLLEFGIPPEATEPGCWTIIVTSGSQMAMKRSSFFVLPAIDSATLDGEKIIVAGTGLDAMDCDNAQLSFTLLNGTKSQAIGKITRGSDEITISLSKSVATAAGATWKLQAQFAGKDLKGSPIQLTVKPK